MSRLCLDRAAITALSVPMGGLRGKAAAACLLLLIVSLPSCSENASETRIRELEARIERQEIAFVPQQDKNKGKRNRKK